MEVKDRLKKFGELVVFAEGRGKLSNTDTRDALDLIGRASEAIGIAEKYDRDQELWEVFECSIIAGWTGGLYGVWGNEDVGLIVRAILEACESQEERARAAMAVRVNNTCHPSTWGPSWDSSQAQEFYEHMMVEAEPRALAALTLLYLDIESEKRANPENDKAYNDAKSALHTTETFFGFICEFAPPKMAFRAACELYRLIMDTVVGFKAGEIPAISLAPNVHAARSRMLFVSLDGSL